MNRLPNLIETMADPPLLALSGIRYHLGDQTILDGVELAIAPGERLSLVGRTYCSTTECQGIDQPSSFNVGANNNRPCTSAGRCGPVRRRRTRPG